jgi:hypothetical protein
MRSTSNICFASYICAAILGWSCVASAADPAQLDDTGAIAAFKEFVVRNGPTLSLTTANEPIKLVDGHCLATSEDRNCLYRYVRYERPHRAHLVHAYFDNEYDSYLWVRNVDGHITFVPDEPHFSPNGRRFVIVRSCEAPGSFCGVQAWNSSGPKLVWEHRPTEYAVYSFSGWSDDRRVDLTLTTWIDHKLAEKPAALIEDGLNRWRIEGPPEKSR